MARAVTHRPFFNRETIMDKEIFRYLEKQETLAEHRVSVELVGDRVPMRVWYYRHSIEERKVLRQSLETFVKAHDDVARRFRFMVSITFNWTDWDSVVITPERLLRAIDDLDTTEGIEA